jgi:chromosome segregation ATPase
VEVGNLMRLQTHTTLKSDREAVEAQLRAQRVETDEWKAKHATLNEQHSETGQRLASATSERDGLAEENLALQDQIKTNRNALAQLQEQFNLAISELSASTRQLQNAQAELKYAKRRADEAERTQKDLQTEGTTLMRSLDEMRPKIVELTDAKLELGEKVSSLEHALRSRDGFIAKLESTVDELQNQKDIVDKQRQEVLALLEAERSSSQTNSMEFQTAYAELQAELDASRANVQALETERVKHTQEVVRRLEEFNHSSASSREHMEEISFLRRELDERKSAEEEEEDLLGRAQSEIESLRFELAARDEEVERLREFAINSAPPSGVPRSLDDEMLSSLQQQRALDLSAAQSRNRELETAVFEAQARAHALQKQVNMLEDQLAQTRPLSRTGRRSFSPGIPSRPTSRGTDHTDLRRASFNARRPSNLTAPPLVRSVFDVGLSPDTRHKRQISLSMLKARIDSEIAAASSAAYPPSRTILPAASLATIAEPASHVLPRRPQFLDESHVFWCHSCRGDLVVL